MDEESETFLKDRLGIPAQWIEQARSVKARYCSQSRLEARSLLAAGLYTEAHDVICDSIAPEAILSESYQQLEDLLAPLAQPQRCSLIADWSIKGKVYWNYMTVVKAVENILKQVFTIILFSSMCIFYSKFTSFFSCSFWRNCTSVAQRHHHRFLFNDQKRFFKKKNVIIEILILVLYCVHYISLLLILDIKITFNLIH